MLTAVQKRTRNWDFGNNIFHGTVDSVRGKVCSTRCRGNRPISLQLNVYFCAPARRHKVTRNILISVFLVACDTDRSHQKAQAEKTNRNMYALPPLLSCCSLLSHKCGWVFGWSMHVVRIRLTGAMVIEILHHLTHNTVQPERRRYISPWAANYSHRKHSRTHGHYNWNAERPHWIRIPIQWFCLPLWNMFVPKTIKQRRPCKKDWNEKTKL